MGMERREMSVRGQERERGREEIIDWGLAGEGSWVTYNTPKPLRLFFCQQQQQLEEFE